MAAEAEPQLILIDHATGEISLLEGRPVEDLASTLVEQARAVQTAAVGTPPDNADLE